MMRKLIYLALAFTLLAFISACGGDKEKAEEKAQVTSEQVERQAKETAESATAYVAQKKDEFVQGMEREYTDIEKKINDLQARLSQETEEKKATLNEKLEQLQQKKETASKKIAEMKSASAETWENMKADVSQAMEDLKKSYEEAVSKF